MFQFNKFGGISLYGVEGMSGTGQIASERFRKDYEQNLNATEPVLMFCWLGLPTFESMNAKSHLNSYTLPLFVGIRVVREGEGSRKGLEVCQMAGQLNSLQSIDRT